MIYESVNLKGVVYELKQNSFSLRSITTCTGFANVDPVFCTVHSLSSEQVFINTYSMKQPNLYYFETIKMTSHT